MLSDNSNFLYSRHVRLVGMCRLQLTKRYVVGLQNSKNKQEGQYDTIIPHKK